MAWNDVEWTSQVDAGGDETKLDNMQGNLDHIRTYLSYSRVVNGCCGRSEGGAGYLYGSSSSTVCRIACGGQVSATFPADGSLYSFEVSGINLSSLSPGTLGEFIIEFQAQSGGTWYSLAEIGRFWFLRQGDDTHLRVAGGVQAHANKDWYQYVAESRSGYLWCVPTGVNVVVYRSGGGDADWSDVEFEGPTPGPAELVSDTDMNQMHLNAEVLRRVTNARSIGGSCIHGTGVAAEFQGTLEENHSLQFQLLFDGAWSWSLSTPYGPHASYETHSVQNVIVPYAAGWGGLAMLEVRVAFANASAPGQYVGEDGNVGTLGWRVGRMIWWRTPDDIYLHFFVCPRTWFSRDRWLRPNWKWVTTKTLGMQAIVTREALS